MKGITKGECIIDRHPEIDSSGRAVYRISTKNEPTKEELKENAKLIQSAFNLTNAGYNIEAMPQLVEVLEKILKKLEMTELSHKSTFGDSYKKSLEALKSAKL